jgi:hypothetical protein
VGCSSGEVLVLPLTMSLSGDVECSLMPRQAAARCAALLRRPLGRCFVSGVLRLTASKRLLRPIANGEKSRLATPDCGGGCGVTSIFSWRADEPAGDTAAGSEASWVLSAAARARRCTAGW